MFFYDYKATVSSVYDLNSLFVVGYIRVFLDEAKTIYLTEIPFPRFAFSEIPDKTTDGFNAYVDNKVNELVNSEEWQNKLMEIKLAMELGIYQPQQ
jgi:hypothetical protein